MKKKTIKRYSDNFKLQVVSELESGRFSSIEQAKTHYEIGGASTIKRWIKDYGKNHLLPRRVRVEQIDESDRFLKLNRKVEGLERSLGRTQAKNIVNETYLELACEQLGLGVEDFKKKIDGKRFTDPASKGVLA